MDRIIMRKYIYCIPSYICRHRHPNIRVIQSRATIAHKTHPCVVVHIFVSHLEEESGRIKT